MWVVHKFMPFSLMTLAALVVCGVCVPAFYPRSKGMASILLILWDWGAGFATVAIAVLVILSASISLARNLPSVPVVIASLFGVLTLLVGSQIVQLYVVAHLVHPGFRYATPSWGLWLAFVPSLLGVVAASFWIEKLRTPGLRRESDDR